MWAFVASTLFSCLQQPTNNNNNNNFLIIIIIIINNNNNSNNSDFIGLIMARALVCFQLKDNCFFKSKCLSPENA